MGSYGRPNRIQQSVGQNSSNGPENDLLGTLTTGARKDRTVPEVACDGPYFGSFCCSQPDGIGADIGSDEGRELTKREPPRIMGMWSDVMDDDYAQQPFGEGSR